MVVIILEKVPVSLRGELTRWLLELKTGVFIGHVSAMVRDKLWEDICTRSRGGAAVLIYGADNEQGFAVRMCRSLTMAAVAQRRVPSRRHH